MTKDTQFQFKIFIFNSMPNIALGSCFAQYQGS